PWIVESHRLAELGDVLRARVRWQEQERRITGQVKDQEDNKGHTEEHETGLPPATDEVRRHRARSGAAVPAAPGRTTRRPCRGARQPRCGACGETCRPAAPI